MRKPPRLSKRLLKLEEEAARLLMHIGDIGTVYDYDSARLGEALGAAASARNALRDARIVVEVREKHGELT